MPSRSHPLRTTEHDGQLNRLLEGLPQDGILAIGEPTHGSANVSAWKFAVIHALAQRGLLTMLAFEDAFVTGLEVDRALRHGGDVARAWSRGSSVWDTITIRAGMERLQQISLARPAPDRVRYLGFDIRKPNRAAAMLIEAGHREQVLGALRDGTELSPSQIDELLAVCIRIGGSGNPREVAVADQIQRHVDAYLREPDLARLHRRDTHMAEVLLANLPTSGVTVVWAHNEHVARNPDFYGGPSLGAVLSAELGDRYRSVGVLCGSGTCRAVDPAAGSDDYRTVPLPPMRACTTEAALAADGRHVVTASEFSHPGPRRFIGWRVDTGLFDTDPESFEVERPSSDFSALVYLPTSEADTSAPKPV